MHKLIDKNNINNEKIQALLIADASCKCSAFAIKTFMWKWTKALFLPKIFKPIVSNRCTVDLGHGSSEISGIEAK